MVGALVITVHLHNDRYHGSPEWPPSPARLFQALVAGAALGSLSEDVLVALEWLETLGPTTIAFPRAKVGQPFTNYVPDNDLDAVDGDPGRVSEVRDAKRVQPRLLDGEPLFLYGWSLENPVDCARNCQAVRDIVGRLYQFGRGIDMAWATSEVVTEEEFQARLSSYPGTVWRPSPGGAGRTLACPVQGSLRSLLARHAAGCSRLKADPSAAGSRRVFSQLPAAHFLQVPYDSPPSRRLYELRHRSGQAGLAALPLALASSLVVWLRDGAVERLRRALPDSAAQIEQVLVGRKPDGTGEGPTSLRVRIVPLPSIGFQHADRGIRRVLVEVPAGGPVRPDDVHWAFSGLDLKNTDLDAVVVPAGHAKMLEHFGVEGGARSRIWRSVTPAALPEAASWRRIDPKRIAEEAKDGAERAAEEARAAAAVAQALRHAGVHARAETIRVQREPFEGRGERAEAFAPGTRFRKERLWHVEVAFDAPVQGPLVIGDGRFLGLGVMAPARQPVGVHAFAVEGGLATTTDPEGLARALRRAVMARVQEVLGPHADLPGFFTGHEAEGSPSRSGHRHLSFAFDPGLKRLLVLAPHVVDRRAPTQAEIRYLDTLDTALARLSELRAGAAGCLSLRADAVDPGSDPLFAPFRVWVSVTSYLATRHAKHIGAAAALSADLAGECLRRGLPKPAVTPGILRGVEGAGLSGEARIEFDVAVDGPILLGRSCHLGGGLFAGGGREASVRAGAAPAP